MASDRGIHGDCIEDIREELKFLHERSKVHFRSIPVPLLSDFEDFTSPAENYSKYKNLKNDLVRVQRRLSKMDIVEWHEITGSLNVLMLFTIILAKVASRLFRDSFIDTSMDEIL